MNLLAVIRDTQEILEDAALRYTDFTSRQRVEVTVIDSTANQLVQLLRLGCDVTFLLRELETLNLRYLQRYPSVSTAVLV